MDLKEKRDFYKNWIVGHQKGNDIFPEMSKFYQQAELQLQIVNKIPDIMTDLKSQVEEKFLNESDYLNDKIKLAEYSSDFNIKTLHALVASGSTSGYSEIATYESCQENENIEWKYEIADWMLDTKNSSDKISFISCNIGRIWIKLKEEFDESVNKYEKINNDLVTQVDFGIIMRIVMEHIQGRLFQAAREIAKIEYTKVNKNLKWARMSDFVAIGGKDSNEHEELVELHGSYTILWVELTNVSKNNKTSNKQEMKEIYAQYIEFLNSLLLNLDLEKISNLLQQGV